ncbi:MAG: hypothetical protein HY298_16715 [Verrucomicrobia bacterium]|nr:hypothetical protein [Verrucomicrobiota bacterium]
MAIISAAGAFSAEAQPTTILPSPATGSPSKPGDTYETQAKGIRILPGQWRPHYPWEQIAWISPAWPSQDYIWLDFPEAIFTSQGLLYLSHVNPGIDAVFPDLPKVPWREVPNGIAFDRQLPNGVSFGGSVTKQNDTRVALELHLKNGSARPLRNISLQTCAFLRGIREFSDYTRDNKFVHVPETGWIPLSQAVTLKGGSSPYRVGWRTSGKPVADWPVMVTRSNKVERWVGMTWHKDTLSLIGNQNHPCMHADPKFKDLEPGEAVVIHGTIFFFEGKLADFDFAKEAGV